MAQSGTVASGGSVDVVVAAYEQLRVYDAGGLVGTLSRQNAGGGFDVIDAIDHRTTGEARGWGGPATFRLALSAGAARYVVSTCDAVGEPRHATIGTIAEAAAVVIPPSVDAVTLDGYWSIGDGGAARYRRVTVQPAHAGAFRSGDGAWWELASLEVNFRQFGVRSTQVPGAVSASDNTARAQAAIDFVAARGGGSVWIYDGDAYELAQSALAETYDNDGAAVAASTGCLIVRQGVSIRCGGQALIYCTDPTRTVVYMLSPKGQAVEGIDIDGGWTYGVSAAGHGIFTLSTGGDHVCEDLRFTRIKVRHVASYGIGLQNGRPRNVGMEDIYTEYTGADGLDLKSRDNVGGIGEDHGNYLRGIVVRDHGSRVTGSAGVDMRGVWNVTGLDVSDFGARNPANDYYGARFRTKPTAASGNPAGERGTLSQFLVDCTQAQTAGAQSTGIYSGSDDVSVSNGLVLGGTYGVSLTGNANGSPLRNKVASVTCIGASQYNFLISTGTDGAVLEGCVSMNAGVAGYRNAGSNSVMDGISVGDASARSTATASDLTERSNITTVGGDFLCFQGAAVLTRSAATNTAMRLYGKGTGGVQLRDGTGVIVDAVQPSGEASTGLGVAVILSGSRVVKYASVGAADSAGAGYRMLRIPN